MDIDVRDDFIHLINENGYKIAGEIGLDQGDNACHLLDNTDLEKLYCFEKWTTGRSKRGREKTLKRMEKYGDRFVLVEGNSSVSAEQFEDGFFDYIYIDGDHRYRGAKRDIQAFWPKVREGGFFGGHDYVSAKGCGVIRAVEEFKAVEKVEFAFTGEFLSSFWTIK